MLQKLFECIIWISLGIDDAGWREIYLLGFWQATIVRCPTDGEGLIFFNSVTDDVPLRLLGAWPEPIVSGIFTLALAYRQLYGAERL